MALAFDATSSAGGFGTGPFSFSHTCSGSDRVLFVIVSIFDSSDVVTGITYNGAAMTALPGGSVANGQYSVVVYYLIAPATGANTVSVSVSGSVFDFGVGAISFTGADQTTPYGTVVTATGASTTPSVTVTSAAGEIVLDGLNIIHGGTLSVGAGQTQRWNVIGGNGFLKYGGSTEPGASSVTMSWSNSTSQTWALLGFPVKPVATPASPTLFTFTLLGVGR